MIREQIRRKIVELPGRYKRAILLVFDAIALSITLWASFALRLDRWVLPPNWEAWLIVVSAPIVSIPVFIRLGLYRAVVRYLPEKALWTIFKAMALATLIWVMLAFLSATLGRVSVPRSVPIIYWAIGTVIIIGSRFAAKWLFWPRGQSGASARPVVLIYGAGNAGSQLAESLRHSHTIAGFVDDDPALHRRDVAGIRVYPPSSLSTLVDEFGVKQVILSIPSLSVQRRKEVIEEINRHGVKVQALPGIGDIVTGRYLVSQLREIDVDDLLGRSSIPPDQELVRKMVLGRSILVTGAGGSIGSELCRKISLWRPQHIVILDANEFALYKIEQELSSRSDLAYTTILTSVLDSDSVRAAISNHNVDVIFHAAAHKHVPLVEANALEGIRNNVFGTQTVAEAAYDLGVKSFVLISTDKAVRPTNVMGGTKRWAELVVQAFDAKAKANNTGQKFCCVRFGNVLGSNGSVVPLFKEQISRGGPVTLTDPSMTRYFMSIREAAELIVQAAALSQGGDVFLLDMGEPVLIRDLAENMIRLAGLSVRGDENPNGDIEIVITGKRPGEKMYEELFYDEASAQGTTHPKILRATGSGSEAPMSDMLVSLRAMLDSRDEPSARHLLFSVVSSSHNA